MRLSNNMNSIYREMTEKLGDAKTVTKFVLFLYSLGIAHWHFHSNVAAKLKPLVRAI